MAFVNNATVSSFQIYQIIACNKHSNINVEALFPLPEILAKQTKLLFKLNIIWMLTTPTCLKQRKLIIINKNKQTKRVVIQKYIFLKICFFYNSHKTRNPFLYLVNLQINYTAREKKEIRLFVTP